MYVRMHVCERERERAAHLELRACELQDLELFCAYAYVLEGRRVVPPVAQLLPTRPRHLDVARAEANCAQLLAAEAACTELAHLIERMHLDQREARRLQLRRRRADLLKLMSLCARHQSHLLARVASTAQIAHRDASTSRLTY